MYFIVLIVAAIIAGHQVVSQEERPIRPCICPLDFKPVCGTNNVTYGNSCELKCAQQSNQNIRFACDGKCPCRCLCTREYKPVCGCDGNTYGNQCLLDCARKLQNYCLTAVCDAPCPCRR